MRMLFLSSVSPSPAIDGSSITVAEVTRALSQRHEVTLAYFGPHQASEVQGDYKWVVLEPRAKWLRYLPIVWPEFLIGVPFSVFPFRGRQARRRVRELIREGEFDAIVCHMVHTAELMPTRCAIPSCMIIQDVVHHAIRGTRGYDASLARRLYSAVHVRQLLRYEKKHYSRFGCRTVVSTAERARAMALNVGEVSVVANGVDVFDFAPSMAMRDRHALVYVGNLRASRNEEAAWIVARTIFPLVKERLSGAKLYVVGAGPSDRLLRLAESEEGLVVTGQVDDVRPYLNEARVFLAPQRVGTGIKTSVLQALAMEAPVVASAPALEGFDGCPESDYLIRETAREFADAALMLLEDDRLATSLGASGRALVRSRYSWDVYALRVEELLQNCAEHEARRV